MKAQWQIFAFWISAVLVVVLATIFYQPAAAKTGSLLVWTRNLVYVMDIDTLLLERVAPAETGESITPAPGCLGATETPCWVLVSDRLYRIEHNAGGVDVVESRLPTGQDYQWHNGVASWSPDGLHLAYAVFGRDAEQFEWWIVDTSSGEVKVRAPNVDPTVAVVWKSGCEAGLNGTGCEVGYKKMAAGDLAESALPALVGFSPGSGQVRQWTISPAPIFELRWSPDDLLLYSRPKRHFQTPAEHAPAYEMPPGAQLANMSPNAAHTVYYQPFTLRGCQSTDSEGNCMHLGVWVATEGQETPDLIYNVELTAQSSGLNFIPTWNQSGTAFVFFQEGNLVHYDLGRKEATIWYKSVRGKLRSVPVFSPNEEALAFVDNQGQGFSEYRLVVINPRLQPVEHIIETDDGFRLLAWLPD